METEAFVFWPGGEREHFMLDRSRLDSKGLANAGNLLTGLSIGGSILRGSVATGRAQTLTCLIPPPDVRDGNVANIRAVRIAGGDDAALATVVAFRGRNEAAGREAALAIVADETGTAILEMATILARSAPAPTVAIVAHGAKTDAAIDEAYGLALYLGAAMNGGS